jgi:hypothetical protein
VPVATLASGRFGRLGKPGNAADSRT